MQIECKIYQLNGVIFVSGILKLHPVPLRLFICFKYIAMSFQKVFSINSGSSLVGLRVRASTAPGLTSRNKPLKNRNNFLVVAQAEEAEVASLGVVTEDVPNSVTAEEQVITETVQQSSVEEGFVPVLKLEDLPKGVRKEVRVDGQNVLLFWYRNELYSIQSRSPAEGAYSEGFITAKFTQDFGIECPSTKSTFSLKTGEILTWYPDNFVLRTLTPSSTVRPLEIYPNQVVEDTIYVNVSQGTLGGVMNPVTTGGTATSSEQNNVFGLQPQVYVEGSDKDSSGSSESQSPVDVSTFATLVVAFSAVALIGTVGTAVSLFYEDYVLLGGFWAVILVFGGFFGYQFINIKRQQ
eukprot:TRINITY_DN605_c2_g1_i2.p2 TRINITY_DN605_c2_g1~~TRINITY_DN605_c2_g1_i2.p2  ORF type:complete len:351 (-),score=53.35 TRINITY_DN605_c2_g1_i2:268-1320(-)